MKPKKQSVPYRPNERLEQPFDGYDLAGVIMAWVLGVLLAANVAAQLWHYFGEK